MNWKARKMKAKGVLSCMGWVKQLFNCLNCSMMSYIGAFAIDVIQFLFSFPASFWFNAVLMVRVMVNTILSILSDVYVEEIDVSL